MKSFKFIVILLLNFSYFALGQVRARLDVSTSIKVYFVVIDPMGRKTGCDPRGNLGETFIKQIPHTNYGFESLGDNPGPGDSVSVDVSLDFEFFPRSSESDGIYAVQVIGRYAGKYTLSTHYDKGGIGNDFETFGIIEPDSAQTYQFEYKYDSTTVIHVIKIVTLSTLRQDLAASYKLKLLGGEKFFKELNKDLDKIEKELAKKDSTEAREQLQEFWKEIEEVQREALKEKDKDDKKEKFITKEAYDILKEDVTLLQAKLPQRKSDEDQK